MAVLGVTIALLLGGGVAGVATNTESDDDTVLAADDTTASNASVQQTPVSVPAGWRTIGGKLEGYSIALPPGWSDLPLDALTLGDAIEDTVKANPALANALQGQLREILNQGGKLFAFQDGSDGAVNINLIATPSGGASLADIKGVVPVELTDAGARGLRAETVRTPAGDALKVAYTLPLRMPGGPTVNVEQTQYVFVRGRQVYVLTGSTPNRTRDGATIDGIAGTLSF
jgi:hypothetical protein